MLEEFTSLRAEGVNITGNLVHEMTIRLLNDPETPIITEEDENHAGRSAWYVISLPWVKSFINTDKMYIE